jgi:hypothetical protein
VPRDVLLADARARHAALPRADLHICGHTAAPILSPQHKLVYSRCCLIMGNCECSLSRPLRPANYASLPKDFVSGCIDHESMFGRNFDTLFGVKLRDLEVRRMLDMWLYVHMYREREDRNARPYTPCA